MKIKLQDMQYPWIVQFCSSLRQYIFSGLPPFGFPDLKSENSISPNSLMSAKYTSKSEN